MEKIPFTAAWIKGDSSSIHGICTSFKCTCISHDGMDVGSVHPSTVHVFHMMGFLDVWFCDSGSDSRVSDQ
jgi:hypothetical protein